MRKAIIKWSWLIGSATSALVLVVVFYYRSAGGIYAQSAGSAFAIILPYCFVLGSAAVLFTLTFACTDCDSPTRTIVFGTACCGAAVLALWCTAPQVQTDLGTIASTQRQLSAWNPSSGEVQRLRAMLVSAKRSPAALAAATPELHHEAVSLQTAFLGSKALQRATLYANAVHDPQLQVEANGVLASGLLTVKDDAAMRTRAIALSKSSRVSSVDRAKFMRALASIAEPTP